MYLKNTLQGVVVRDCSFERPLLSYMGSSVFDGGAQKKLLPSNPGKMIIFFSSFYVFLIESFFIVMANGLETQKVIVLFLEVCGLFVFFVLD